MLGGGVKGASSLNSKLSSKAPMTSVVNKFSKGSCVRTRLLHSCARKAFKRQPLSGRNFKLHTVDSSILGERYYCGDLLTRDVKRATV